jgi:hypothetical protein
MRFKAALLICLAVGALMLGLVVVAGGVVALEVPVARYRDSPEHRIEAPSSQAHPYCARPSALHLLRFEDGSAQLKCGKRVLTRVSIPGR